MHEEMNMIKCLFESSWPIIGLAFASVHGFEKNPSKLEYVKDLH